MLDPPSIVPTSQYQLSLAFPDLGQHKVQDLFANLGPVAIFSAKHHWTAPRTVRLKKREHEGYGFSVRGDAPVIIAGVDMGSIAEVTKSNNLDAMATGCCKNINSIKPFKLTQLSKESLPS